MKAVKTRADRVLADGADRERKWRNRNMRVTVARFNTVIARVRHAAHKCGYAIAVHGSLLRDIDLLAAPWTREAKGQTTLFRAVCKALDAFPTGAYVQRKQPEKKPHGRLAWSIHIGGSYVDLSVMPRRA